MTLEEAQVGHPVLYTPYLGCSPDQVEQGVITSVGKVFVFVRYGGDLYPKATSAGDLKYAIPVAIR